MTLIERKWMPAHHRNGQRVWISPLELSNPDIVSFDADRPDFNGALAQFAIGLLQTTTPVGDPVEWGEKFNNPPTEDELAEWFAPVKEAFVFDGDGARFMQDLTLKAPDAAECDIAALFIDAPGESTTKKNTDLFVKRNPVEKLCPDCAALALFCLQTNSPAGGAGHRTGMRGGGPLTTLWVEDSSHNLWRDLWLNVCPRNEYIPGADEKKKNELFYRFPWMVDIKKIQPNEKKGETTPEHVHPLHVFWTMPRRIRFVLDEKETGECDLCGGSSSGLIRRYYTRPYGLNYKGVWRHPFSPHYETNEGWLPLHPQPGGIGYRHWLPFVLGQSSKNKKIEQARIVARSPAINRSIPMRLWAFGYDMDNMKARCWYEATLPIYGLDSCSENAVTQQIKPEIQSWLDGAELAVFFLRTAVKNAWFDEARGDFSMIDAAFWARTESGFYANLRGLKDVAEKGNEEGLLSLREGWKGVLYRCCLELFDGEFVGAGQVDRQNPKRVATAYLQLKKNLNGPKMYSALRLPEPERKQSKDKVRARKTVA